MMASRGIDCKTIDVIVREADVVQFFDRLIRRSVVVEHSGNNLRHMGYPDATDDGMAASISW